MLPWIIVAGLAAVLAASITLNVVYRETAHEDGFRIIQLERELKDAHNRLFAAYDGGKVIPPSDLPLVDPVAETPMPRELQEFLDQYHEPAARAKFERIVRQGLAKQQSPLVILKQFEQPEV